MANLSDYKKQVVNGLGQIAKNTKVQETKTPSGGENYDELSYKYMTAIGGLLGAIIVGKEANKVLDNPDSVKNIIQKCDKGIFRNVDNIQKSVDDIKNLMQKVYPKTLDNLSKNINTNLKSIIKTLNDKPSSIDVIMQVQGEGAEDLLRILANSAETEDVSNNLSAISMMLDNIANNIDFRSSMANIADLTEYVNNLNESIKGFNIDTNQLDDVVNTIGKLNNIKLDNVSIDTKKIESIITAINKLNKIEFGKVDGDNLKEENVQKLNNILTALNELGNTDIDPSKFENVSKSLIKITKFLKGDGKGSFKLVLNELRALNKEFGTEEFKGLANAIQATKNIFDMLISTDQLSLWKLVVTLPIKLELVRNILDENINELIQLVIALGVVELDSSTKRISNMFNMIEDVLDDTPSIKTSLIAMTRLDLLNDTVIKSISNLVSNINELKSRYKIDNNKEALDTLINVTTKNLDKAINEISSIDSESAAKTLKILNKGVFVELQKAIVGIKELSDKKYKINKTQLNAIINAVSLFSKNSKLGKAINDLIRESDSKNLSNTLKSFIEAVKYLTQLSAQLQLATILKVDKGVKIMTTALNSLNKALNEFNFSKDKLEQLQNALKAIKTINLIIAQSAAILILGSLTMMIINPINLIVFTACLSTFILSIVVILKFAKDKLKESLEGAKGLSILIMASAAALIIGSLLVHTVKWENIVKFTAYLSGFISALFIVYKIFKPAITMSLETAKALSLLVIVSGAILMLAGKIMTKNDVWAAVGFGVVLGIFINVICIALKFFDGNKEGMFKSAMALSVLVGTLGTVLIVAGKLLTWQDWLMALGFAAVLAAFIIGIHFAFKHWDLKDINMTIKSAIALGIVIAVSGTVLMIAGKLLTWQDWLIALGFAVVLGLFIAGICAAYKLLGDSIQYAYQASLGLAIVVATSALVLLIAAKTLSWEEFGMAVAFGVVLAGFIFLIAKTYTKFGKELAQILPAAIGLSIVTAISGVVLMIAAKLLTIEDMGIALLFVGVLWLFMMGMTAVLGILAYQGKEILFGTVAIVGIAVALLISVFAFTQIANIISIINSAGGDAWSFLGYIAIIGATFAAMSIICAFLGANAPLILIGVGVAAAMGAAMWIIADAMQKAAKAMEQMSKIKSFDSKALVSSVEGFINVAKAMTKMSPLASEMTTVSIAIDRMTVALSKIAKAVQEYSSLTVPIYEGTKKVGYAKLTPKDFESASKNVSLVISTLGKAIMNAYHKDPEIFETDWKGTSKFSIVVKSVEKLGPMLASIARGVKNYANLTVPVYDGTKIVGYDRLTPTDFSEASKNISLVISILGKSVMDSYDMNPEIFETNFIGKSKFSKVVSSLIKLGPMISSIAKSVKDYANMTIPVTWKYNESTGKMDVTEYRQLEQSDFSQASMNVQHIISTLGSAIIAAYEDHPEYYDSGMFSKSPFVKTINANMNLANLITKIAKAVKDYANLTVAEDYLYDPNTGKLNAHSMRSLNKQDFEQASSNVQLILSTLGEAIIKTYEKNPKYYDSGLISNSPFTKTINANMNLANLITKIAKAVKDYANMTVVEFENNGGKIVEVKRKLDRSDFTTAANNIKSILEILGKSIINTYENNKKMYDSAGLFGGKSPFEKTITANTKLANLISGIAKGIQDFALLQVPVYKKGSTEIQEYRQLDKSDFRKAAENITLITSVLGGAIIKAYDAHPEWYDDGEDSKFSQACISITGLANMITGIAGGIKAFAELQIPEYNDKNDPTKITGYRQLDKPDFEKAEKHIRTIIGTLGKAVIDETSKNSEWFDAGEDSKFAKACKSVSTMGEMLSTIGEGIKNYAELRIPIKWDEKGNPTEFQSLLDADISKAQTNIQTLISSLGATIIELYATGKATVNGKEVDVSDMFKMPNLWERFITGNSDNKFVVVVKSVHTLSNVISTMSEAIKDMAELKVATEWDAQGNPTKYRNLINTDFELAKEHINAIITTFAETIVEKYKESPELFDIKGKDSVFLKTTKALSLIGNVISKTARSVASVASMLVPTYNETTGEITGYEKLNKTHFEDASSFINTLMTSLFESVKNTYDDNKQLFDNANVLRIVKAMTNITAFTGNMVKIIREYAELRLPVYDGDNIVKGKYSQMKDEDFEAAGKHIAKVLTTISNEIVKIVKDPVFEKTSPAIDNVAKMYKQINAVLLPLSASIANFANMTFTDPETKKIKRLGNTEIGNAITNIGEILSAIGTAIKETIVKNESIFGGGTWNTFCNGFRSKVDESKIPALVAAKAIGMMADPIVKIAKVLGSFTEGDIVEQVFDSNGNLIGTKTIPMPNITLAKERIKTLLVGLGEAISEVWNTHSKIMSGKDSTVNKVTKGLNTIVDLILYVTKTLTDFQNSSKDGVNGTNIGEVVENIQKIFGVGENYSNTGLSFIMSSLFNEESKWNDWRKNYDASSDNVKHVHEGFSDFMNNAQDIIETIFAASKVINEKYKIIKSNIDSLGKSTGIKDTLDKFKNIIDEIVTHKKELLKNVDDSWITRAKNKIADRLLGKEGKYTLTTLLNEYMDEINNIDNVVVTLLSSIDNIQAHFNKVSHNTDIFGEDSALVKLISNYQTIAATILTLKSTLKENENDPLSNILLFKDFDNNVDITTVLDDYARTIMNIVHVGEYSANVDKDTFKNISEGIETVYSATSKISEVEKFKSHTETLDKYIRTVNSLNANKIDRLIKMTTAMTHLANKIGNIDKFTEVLAEEISVVLTKLTNELKTAKETIDKSEKIQKKRHELIRESIKSVKEIMEDPLRIEIGKVDDSTELKKKTNNTNRPSPSPSPTPAPKTSLSDGGGTVTEEKPKELVPSWPSPTTDNKTSNNTNFIPTNNDNIERKVNEILETVNKINSKV